MDTENILGREPRFKLNVPGEKIKVGNIMVSNLLKRMGGLVGLSIFALGAQASLIDDEITVAWDNTRYGQILGGPYTFIVEAGSDDTQTFTGPVTVDVGAESFQIDYTSSFSVSQEEFNGLIFSDLNWVGQQGAITNVTYDVVSGSLDGLGVAFTDNSVRINFARLNESKLNPFSLTVYLETTHASVPEPGVVGMLLLGLAGLAASRKLQA